MSNANTSAEQVGGGTNTTPSSEHLLNRLATAENGEYFALVKLCGAGVPQDLDLYFCKNSFTALQVRVRTSVDEQVHEYAISPRDVAPKGGVYELKSLRSAHDLQLKVQPALGLLHLIKPPPYSTAQEVDCMQRKLYAVAGLFHLLHAFQRDPSLEAIPLKGATPGVGAQNGLRHVDRLLADEEVLQQFLTRCSCFSRHTEGGMLMLRVADCARPRTRGMIVKALVEVKMLLVIVVEHFQDDESQFTPRQLQEFHNFLIDIHEDCCAGGARAQYKPMEESWRELKSLVVGPRTRSDEKSGDSKVALTASTAWKLLQDCVTNIKENVLPRLVQKGQAADVDLPSHDFRSASGGADFKLAYKRIWLRAIDVYLYDLSHSSQYSKGPEEALASIHRHWRRPDEALKLLCPSVALDQAIAAGEKELSTLLAEKAKLRRSGIGKDGINLNPCNATGLINPGENLCAANALLQLLFSAPPFREMAVEHSTIPEEKQGSPAIESDAIGLVAGMKRLFTEMSHPDRATSCARDVAAALYGKELGQQQDCDELLHRLSLLLEDGLTEVNKRAVAQTGENFSVVGSAFRRAFTGSTYEIQLPAQENCESATFPVVSQDARSKSFLSIPVQEGNKNILQALEEFISWSPTGGRHVAWTQERFKTVPPYLCFASRQVSSVHWEDSLNLTPLVASVSTALQQSQFEHCRASLLLSDLRDAVKSLEPACRSLENAISIDGQDLAKESEQVKFVLTKLRGRLSPLEADVAKSEQKLGDGFDESDLDDFAHGIVSSHGVPDVLREHLSIGSVKELADKVMNGSVANDNLSHLVCLGKLSRSDADSIAAKLAERWATQHQHMYDVHALIAYQGLGNFGHYMAFIRQADGAFLCFDDEQVSQFPNANAVRQDIDNRCRAGMPASIRMLVYRRAAKCEPLELEGPLVPNAADAGNEESIIQRVPAENAIAGHLVSRESEQQHATAKKPRRT